MIEQTTDLGELLRWFFRAFLTPLSSVKSADKWMFYLTWIVFIGSLRLVQYILLAKRTTDHKDKWPVMILMSALFGLCFILPCQLLLIPAMIAHTLFWRNREKSTAEDNVMTLQIFSNAIITVILAILCGVITIINFAQGITVDYEHLGPVGSIPYIWGIGMIYCILLYYAIWKPYQHLLARKYVCYSTMKNEWTKVTNEALGDVFGNLRDAMSKKELAERNKKRREQLGELHDEWLYLGENDEGENMVKTVNEVDAFSVAAQRNRTPFITRKFAGRLTSEGEITRFESVMETFLEYENAMLLYLMNKEIPIRRPVEFRKKGTTSYKGAYDLFKIREFEGPTHNGIHFKERMKRTAFFRVYFILRNWIVRNGNLVKIAERLKSSTTGESPLPGFLRDASLDNERTNQIRSELRKDVFDNYQDMSTEFFKNHLRQLRNALLEHGLERSVLETILTEADNSEAFMSALAEELSGSIKIDKIPVMFRAAVKRQLLRYFHTYSRHGRRPKVSDPLSSEFSDIVDGLGQNCTVKEFIRARDLHLNRYNTLMDANIQIENEVIRTGLAAVFDGIRTADNPTKALFSPSFSKILINSFDETGLRLYVSKRIEYSIKGALSDLLLRSIPTLREACELLLRQFSENPYLFIKVPIIKKPSISLPFKEQLWDVHVERDEKNRLYATANFAPLRNKAKTQFTFIISPAVFTRLGVTTMDEALSVLKSPPTIIYSGHRVIIAQPFDENVINASTSSSAVPFTADPNVVMGVDLGLKHWAVCSVLDMKQLTERARLFLGQQSVFGKKFNDTTGRMDPLKNPPPNMMRHLYHLRKEISDLQSKKALAEYHGLSATYYHRKLVQRLDDCWKRVHAIHGEIVNQVSHRLVQCAVFHRVSVIKFEDLSWTRHSRKSDAGYWIGDNQTHFLHSQIISKTCDLAGRIGISVCVVDAAWSSQICSECARTNRILQSASHARGRDRISGGIGRRNGKVFVCDRNHGDSGLGFRLDSDLNAARNVSYRAAIHVLV